MEEYVCNFCNFKVDHATWNKLYDWALEEEKTFVPCHKCGTGNIEPKSK